MHKNMKEKQEVTTGVGEW